MEWRTEPISGFLSISAVLPYDYRKQDGGESPIRRRNERVNRAQDVIFMEIVRGQPSDPRRDEARFFYFLATSADMLFPRVRN